MMTKTYNFHNFQCYFFTLNWRNGATNTNGHIYIRVKEKGNYLLSKYVGTFFVDNYLKPYLQALKISFTLIPL